MNLLYPRTIQVTRADQNTAVGVQSYSGVLETNESNVTQGIPAHIQIDRRGPRSPSGLPADAISETLWKIVVKLPRGYIQARDIITDDLGNRYQVVSADWNPLVTTCIAQLLET